MARGRKSKITPEDLQKIKEMFYSGIKKEIIAVKYNVSVRTIDRYLNQGDKNV